MTVSSTASHAARAGPGRRGGNLDELPFGRRVQPLCKQERKTSRATDHSAEGDRSQWKARCCLSWDTCPTPPSPQQPPQTTLQITCSDVGRRPCGLFMGCRAITAFIYSLISASCTMPVFASAPAPAPAHTSMLLQLVAAATDSTGQGTAGRGSNSTGQEHRTGNFSGRAARTACGTIPFAKRYGRSGRTIAASGLSAYRASLGPQKKAAPSGPHSSCENHSPTVRRSGSTRSRIWDSTYPREMAW